MYLTVPGTGLGAGYTAVVSKAAPVPAFTEFGFHGGTRRDFLCEALITEGSHMVPPSILGQCFSVTDLYPQSVVPDPSALRGSL